MDNHHRSRRVLDAVRCRAALIQGPTALAPRAARAGGRARRSSRRASITSACRPRISRVCQFSKVFGLKVLNEDKANKIARMGVTKIIVSLHEKTPVGIVDHFAIAIDDFDKDKVTAELAKLGLKAEENLDYGFFVRDPEGVPVQIVKT
jgi:hypothetical protein